MLGFFIVFIIHTQSQKILNQTNNQDQLFHKNYQLAQRIKLPLTSISQFLSETTVTQEANNFYKRSLSTNSVRQALASSPFIVYQRGVYFPGEIGLSINSMNKLLSINFSLSCWFRPLISSSAILSKYDDQNQKNFLLIYFEDLNLKSRISINGINYEYTPNLTLDLNQWNHIYLSNTFDQTNILKMWLNGYPGQSQQFSDYPFIDSDSGTLFIGSDINNTSPFTGFMYFLEIFNSNQNVSDLVSTNCSSCKACLTNGTCLSTCDVGTYNYSITNTCEKCPENCPNCISDASCSLCKDPKCRTCSSLDLNSCLTCSPQYQMINNTCHPCSNSSYYDSTTSTCLDCPQLCLTCLNSHLCISCQNLSSINNSGLCECDQGYSYNKSCIRNHFSATLEIDENMDAGLNFSEPLIAELNTTQVELFINNNSAQFAVISKNLSFFQLKFDITFLESNSSLVVKFLEEIVSEENSLLGTPEVNATISLSLAQEKTVQVQIKATNTKAAASTGVATGAAVAVGASLINFNPTAFFDFMNTAEMFYSVYFYDIKLNLVLSEFLLVIRLQKSMPDLMSLIFPPKYGKALSTKYQKFGYNTNLLILNTYTNIQTVIILCIIWALVVILMKVHKLREKLKKIAVLFKYEVFLRYWIQCFFEFFVALRVGLMFNTFNNAVQIIDLLFCILIMILLVAGFCFYVYLLSVRRKIKDELYLKEFMEKFGTFFEEFKQDHYKRWMFYLLFLVRRIVILICYAFDNAVFQLSIATVISFLVPLYIFFMQSFKLTFMNIYHISKEMIIAIYHCVLLYSLKDDKMSDEISDVCIRIIITAWAMNVAFSAITSVRMVIGFIKECRRRKNDRMNTVEQISKIQPDLDFDFTNQAENTKRHYVTDQAENIKKYS